MAKRPKKGSGLSRGEEGVAIRVGLRTWRIYPKSEAPPPWQAPAWHGPEKPLTDLEKAELEAGEKLALQALADLLLDLAAKRRRGELSGPASKGD